MNPYSSTYFENEKLIKILTGLTQTKEVNLSALINDHSIVRFSYPGLKLLHEGMAERVWGINSDQILKVFYNGRKSEPPVSQQMQSEFQAYAIVCKFAEMAPSPLPKIFASSVFYPSPSQKNASCGWCVLSRTEGSCLTAEDIKDMTPDGASRWTSNLVTEVVKVEKALASANEVLGPKLPKLWQKSFVDIYAKVLCGERKKGSEDSGDLAETIVEIINKHTSSKNPHLQHGSLRLTNVVTNNGKVSLTNPAVSNDCAEANLRFFPPWLMRSCAKKYYRFTKIGSRPDYSLAHAYGALTCLYDQAQAPYKPKAFLAHPYLDAHLDALHL